MNRAVRACGVGGGKWSGPFELSAPRSMEIRLNSGSEAETLTNHPCAPREVEAVLTWALAAEGLLVAGLAITADGTVLTTKDDARRPVLLAVSDNESDPRFRRADPRARPSCGRSTTGSACTPPRLPAPPTTSTTDRQPRQPWHSRQRPRRRAVPRRHGPGHTAPHPGHDAATRLHRTPPRAYHEARSGSPAPVACQSPPATSTPSPSRSPQTAGPSAAAASRAARPCLCADPHASGVAAEAPTMFYLTRSES